MKLEITQDRNKPLGFTQTFLCVFRRDEEEDPYERVMGDSGSGVVVSSPAAPSDDTYAAVGDRPVVSVHPNNHKHSQQQQVSTFFF